MASGLKWDRTVQRLRDQADSKAKEIGPIADELKRQGMTIAAIVDELNRRGFRSVKGSRFTRGILNNVLQRWREMQRREAR